MVIDISRIYKFVVVILCLISAPAVRVCPVYTPPIIVISFGLADPVLATGLFLQFI